MGKEAKLEDKNLNQVAGNVLENLLKLLSNGCGFNEA